MLVVAQRASNLKTLAGLADTLAARIRLPAQDARVLLEDLDQMVI
jgi:hypothetical protein